MSAEEGQRQVLSMRIITTENSLEKPIPSLDVTTSSFRKNSTKRVPVLHLFGATTQGERMCMHVHGVFPYVYIPLEYDPDEAYLQRLAQAIDRAINLSLGRPNSTIQHVFGINIVHGIPYYGFHHKAGVFLKIYIYNPLLISRLSDLLLSGSVMGRSFQPHEAHIPYILQFFIDYNLYGMNFINVSAFMRRKAATDDTPGDGENSLLSGGSNLTNTSSIDTLYKVSTCELEVDVLAADILNKHLIDDHVGTNPGLLALWDDERKRLQSKSLEGEVQLEAPDSQDRSNPPDVGICPIWYQRFIDMVDALDLTSEEDKQSFAIPSTPGGSSLNISDLCSDEEVDERSISQVLNFSANLTQAAEQMSCRELAALLAEESSESEEADDYISYSPRVSPQKGATKVNTDVSLSYSPVSSPRPPENGGDDTLTPTRATQILQSPQANTSLASDDRSISVLSGSSFTSQGSRRSRKSLYKWNKKWSQGTSNNSSAATSPLPILSQSRLQPITLSEFSAHTLSQSTSQLHADTHSQHISQNSDISNASKYSEEMLSQSDTSITITIQSQRSSLDFGGDEDEAWLDAACSDQIRSTFDEMYGETEELLSGGESSDEDLQTTIMTQPVWEGEEDTDVEGKVNRNRESSIPQLDGAGDEETEEDTVFNVSENVDGESTFQVSKKAHPLKLTIRKSVSVSENTPQQPLKSPPANALRLKFRRTSENTYNADHPDVIVVPVPPNNDESPSKPDGEPEPKPKISLSLKSLELKISEKAGKSKKGKDKDRKKAKKEKSHKHKDRHKHKKNKVGKYLDTSVDNTFATDSCDQTGPTLATAESHSMSAIETASPTISCLPKLTFSKKGKHFTVKNSEEKVTPLKLKITIPSPVKQQSKHVSLKSPPSTTVAEKSPISHSKSPLVSPASKCDLLSDLTLSSSDEEESKKRVKASKCDSKLANASSKGSSSIDCDSEQSLPSHKLKLTKTKDTLVLKSPLSRTRNREPAKANSPGPFATQHSNSQRLSNTSTSRDVMKRSMEVEITPQNQISKPQGTFVKGLDYPLTSLSKTYSSHTHSKTNVDPLPPGSEVTAEMNSLPFLQSNNEYHQQHAMPQNTSVFPQPIPVFQEPTLPQSSNQTAKASSRPKTKQRAVKKDQPHSTKTKPTKMSRKLTKFESTKASKPSTSSPDGNFLHTMQLQRVASEDNTNVFNNAVTSRLPEPQGSELNLNSSNLHSNLTKTLDCKPTQLPSAAASLPRNSHQNSILDQWDKPLVSSVEAQEIPLDATIGNKDAFVEPQPSGLYQNFLQTQLGQKPSPIFSQHRQSTSFQFEQSMVNAQNSGILSTASTSDHLQLTGDVLGTQPTVSPIHRSPLLPTTPTDAALPDIPSSNSVKSSGSRVQQPTNDPVSKFTLQIKPQVQQGLFRKKRTHGSKIKRKPHGSRNVPKSIMAIESSLSRSNVALSDGSISNSGESPADDGNSLWGHSLLPNTSLHATTPGTQSESTNAGSLDSQRSCHMVQQDTSVHTARGPSLSALNSKDQSTEQSPMQHTPVTSQDEVRAPIKLKLSISANTKKLEATSPAEPVCTLSDTLKPSAEQRKTRSGLVLDAGEGEVEVSEITNSAKAMVPAAVPELVHVSDADKRVDRGAAGSPASTGSLPKPRSFVDRLSQLSQVLGVAPSDRLLEELPIDLPPLVRKDKLGRRRKRGRTRGTVVSKSQVKPATPTKKRPRKKLAAVQQVRPDRPKRVPTRFLESSSSTSVMPTASDASAKQIPVTLKKDDSAASLCSGLDARKVIKKREAKKVDRPTVIHDTEAVKERLQTRNTLRHRKHEDSKPIRTTRQNSLHRESRRLILRSKQLQRDNLPELRDLSKAVVKPHQPKVGRELILRSAHLPSEQDGRVTLTLRRSVLMQRDALDKVETKSDTQSVSSKSSRKRVGIKHSPVFEVQAVFEGLYAFESDSYARKISLKGAVTRNPSVGIPLTPALVKKAISSTVPSKAKSSNNSFELRSRSSLVRNKKVINESKPTVTLNSKRSSQVLKPSSNNISKPSQEKGSPPSKLNDHSSKAMRPELPCRLVKKQQLASSPNMLLPVSSNSVKSIEHRKIAPRPIGPSMQRSIAPKPITQPSAAAPSSSNMLIIIPSSVLQPTTQLPVSDSSTQQVVTSSARSALVKDKQEATPEPSPVTHGLGALPEFPRTRSSGKLISHSKVQAKPLSNIVGTSAMKPCVVQVSPLASQAKKEGEGGHGEDFPVVTRTTKLRNARSGRGIKGITEDRDLMLKRFLAMPELDVPAKRPCFASSSLSISASDTYCENANNDWQVTYDHALLAAAFMSESEGGRSHSLRVTTCELGDSSHVTDESRAETECSMSPRKYLLEKCHCLDCVVDKNVSHKGNTLLAQCLSNPSSINLSIHHTQSHLLNEICGTWKNVTPATSLCQKLIDVEIPNSAGFDILPEERVVANNLTTVEVTSEECVVPTLTESIVETSKPGNESGSSVESQGSSSDILETRLTRSISKESDNSKIIELKKETPKNCNTLAPSTFKQFPTDTTKELKVVLSDINPLLKKLGNRPSSHIAVTAVDLLLSTNASCANVATSTTAVSQCASNDLKKVGDPIQTSNAVSLRSSQVAEPSIENMSVEGCDIIQPLPIQKQQAVLSNDCAEMAKVSSAPLVRIDVDSLLVPLCDVKHLTNAHSTATQASSQIEVPLDRASLSDHVLDVRENLEFKRFDIETNPCPPRIMFAEELSHEAELSMVESMPPLIPLVSNVSASKFRKRCTVSAVHMLCSSTETVGDYPSVKASSPYSSDAENSLATVEHLNTISFSNVNTSEFGLLQEEVVPFERIISESVGSSALPTAKFAASSSKTTPFNTLAMKQSVYSSIDQCDSTSTIATSSACTHSAIISTEVALNNHDSNDASQFTTTNNLSVVSKIPKPVLKTGTLEMITNTFATKEHPPIDLQTASSIVYDIPIDTVEMCHRLHSHTCPLADDEFVKDSNDDQILPVKTFSVADENCSNRLPPEVVHTDQTVNCIQPCAELLTLCQANHVAPVKITKGTEKKVRRMSHSSACIEKVATYLAAEQDSPINLSVKLPSDSSIPSTSFSGLDVDQPIDLSLKRKLPTTSDQPIDLCIKRRSIQGIERRSSSVPEHPPAIKLAEHFRVVEQIPPLLVQQNGRLPRVSSHTVVQEHPLPPPVEDKLIEQFKMSQTDGAVDSPEPSDNEDMDETSAACIDQSQTGSKQDSNKAADYDTDSDETMWSNPSSDWKNKHEDDFDEVDIVYGTPPDELTNDMTDYKLPSSTAECDLAQPGTSSMILGHHRNDLTHTDRVDDSTDEDLTDATYTAVKRLKLDESCQNNVVYPARPAKRYKFTRAPPSLTSVQSTCLELGLSLVENTYPYFSKRVDCEKALADPMSRMCNRRFNDVCPQHLPLVVLRDGRPVKTSKPSPQIQRFELVRLPPSLHSVTMWLQQRDSVSKREGTGADRQVPPPSEPTAPDSADADVASASDMEVIVPESPEAKATSQRSEDNSRPGSKSSFYSKTSGHSIRSRHHDLFSTQIIQSLNEAEKSLRIPTQLTQISRRSSAFGDTPTDISLNSGRTSRLDTQSPPDAGSYSPLMTSPHPEQSANITRMWSHDKSSIDGMSGRNVAADTHQLLKQMASHNTAHNDMVSMSMEVHVNTRGSLNPDPTQDKVEALFLHVNHDTAQRESFHYVLVSHDGACQHVPQLLLPGATVSVVQCATESLLLEKLVKLVRRHDPDLLVGWEVHNLSWGYLLRRSVALQLNLANELSRIPKPPSARPNQSQEFVLHSSEFARVGGRVLVNMWKVMRHQMGLGLIPSLTNYNIENVVYHILNLRIPKFTYQDLTSWYEHDKNRQRVFDYYLRRVQLLHTMEQQIDFIGQTSEFARVYGIEFCDVIIKGSQYKVESMMLRIAKPLNFVAVSPNVQQRVRMNPPECIPLTLEPESQFYADPVIVLDFQSLYPSIMIAYNYCFSTCLGNIAELERAGGEEFKFGCTSLRVPAHVLSKLKDHINVSPNGVAFVKQHVRKGVISRMVEEILGTRLMVKSCMSRYKSDKGLHKLLHARQLGLKLIANVTFGYTAANFSGRMPCVEVGDSIVRKARETLENAIKMVNENDRWNSRVVYGDTDSLFVLVPGRSLQEAFKVGEEIRDAVTAANPKPIKLKLEKVYMGCVLQTKKRYAGFMYESADQSEPVFDAKGIETVRRDSIPAVSKILEKSLTSLFTTRDLSQSKLYVQDQLSKILHGSAKLQDFIFSKEYRGERGYKPTAKVPSLLIARKRREVDVWSEPLTGERVPYVIVYGAPGTPLYNLVKEPQDVLANPQLKLNTLYYITRVIIPPLHRAYSLLGMNVQSWYEELPKVHKFVGENTATNVKRTLTQYFFSAKCAICESGCQATVCHTCLTADAQSTVIALNNIVGRQLSLEHSISQLCRLCSNIMSDHRVPCTSLDCPALYKKTQLHKQRTLSASLCDKYLGKINNY